MVQANFMELVKKRIRLTVVISPSGWRGVAGRGGSVRQARSAGGVIAGSGLREFIDRAHLSNGGQKAKPEKQCPVS